MAKVKVGGSRRYRAAAGASAGKADAPAAAPQPVGPAPAKHMQRKIARKVKFLDKVSAAGSEAKATRLLRTNKSGVSKAQGKGKRKALPNLAALGASLDELLADAKGQQQGRKKKKAGGEGDGFGESVKSSKERAAVTLQETARLQQVLHHPQYAANPIAAITNHLKATLPAAPPPPAKAGAKKGGKKKAAGSRQQQRDAMVTE